MFGGGVMDVPLILYRLDETSFTHDSQLSGTAKVVSKGGIVMVAA